MIFAITQLEQSLLCHCPIPTGRGAIDPHPFGLQIVHPDDALVQGRFELVPLLVITESIQHNTQAIIAPFLLTNRLSATLLQRVQSRGCPGLHLIHPMVTLRHNVRQPDRCRHAQTGSLPVAMRLKARIQQFCDPHVLALGQQHRNIVHSFCCYAKLFCHAVSLPQFQNLVSI